MNDVDQVEIILTVTGLDGALLQPTVVQSLACGHAFIMSHDDQLQYYQRDILSVGRTTHPRKEIIGEWIIVRRKGGIHEVLQLI